MPATIIQPNSYLPGYSEPNNGSLMLAAAGLVTDTEFFTTMPQTVAVGTPFQTNPILVAGFNSFQVILNTNAGAGNYTVTLQHCNPADQTVLTTFNILSAVAVGGLAVGTFGAGNTAALGGGQVFISYRLLFTAAVASVVFARAFLFFGVR